MIVHDKRNRFLLVLLREATACRTHPIFSRIIRAVNSCVHESGNGPYVLALALFMDMGGGRVMRKLAGTLSWAARGVTVVLPSEEALSRARARLGPVPMRLLFESAAGPMASPDTPGGFL